MAQGMMGLSQPGIVVLGQLFGNGPTWDGNVISKAGRDELVTRGLALRTNGFAYLTEEGVRVASEWSMPEVRRMHDDRWYRKLQR